MKMKGASFHGSTLLCCIIVSSCGASDQSAPWAPRDVEAEVSDSVSTVVNVSWTTDDRTIGYIQYGPDEDLKLRTPMEGTSSRKHQIPLLGLKADTEYFYRVVTWDGDDAAASEIAVDEGQCLGRRALHRCAQVAEGASLERRRCRPSLGENHVAKP